MPRSLRRVATVSLALVLLLVACGQPATTPTDATPPVRSPTGGTGAEAASVGNGSSTSARRESTDTTTTTSRDHELGHVALVGGVHLVGLALDGRSITIRPVPAAEVCPAQQAVAGVDVADTPDAVVVTARMVRTQLDDDTCIEPAVSFEPVTVELDRPLGGRPVVDASAPERPLVPEIEPGRVRAGVHLEVRDSAITGPPAPDGSIDVGYVGLDSSELPVASSGADGLASITFEAFSLDVSPAGEQIWIAVERRATDVPVEPRSRDLLRFVEVSIPAAPSDDIVGQTLVIRLGPGAITTGDDPTIDPSAITITWRTADRFHDRVLATGGPFTPT